MRGHDMRPNISLANVHGHSNTTAGQVQFISMNLVSQEIGGALHTLYEEIKGGHMCGGARETFLKLWPEIK
jgi:hypothetical protein